MSPKNPPPSAVSPSPVLVDSCWYIRGMRFGRDPMQELKQIALVRDLATCGIVRSEVARGLREPKLLKAFQARWDVMLYVPTDNALWSDVEMQAWRLDRAGHNLPLADIVIACCARRIGAVVLTHDKHFSLIPGIQTAEQIV